MKRSHRACAAMLCVLTGCLGYWLHGQGEGARSRSLAKSVPQLDDLIVHESFSLIENTRKDLEGLCARVQLDVEGRLLQQERLWNQPGASDAASESQLNSIIHDLENAMNELKGTEEELYLAEDLFRALKKAERSNRWVEVYLKALYEHPTHPAVGLFAGQAITMGRAAGREEEVICGLRHLCAIPLEFPGKGNAQAALLKAKTQNELTRIDPAMLPSIRNPPLPN